MGEDLSAKQPPKEAPKETVKNYKVIIADDDGQLSRRLADFLRDRNFEVKTAANGKDLKTCLKEEGVPHFLISDLMLPEGNAIEICNFIRQLPKPKEMNAKIIVTSGHNNAQNVKDCFRAGAADYVVKPFRYEDMLSRLVFHIQNRRQVPDAAIEDRGKLSGGDVYLNLLELVLKEAIAKRKLSDTLFNFTKMLALTLKAVRCNIVECSDDQQVGWVRASSDDRNATGIQIDLNRYPEILHVLNTEKVVVIENLDYDPVLAQIKSKVKTISFNSLIVCPLQKRGRFFGVMASRMDKTYAGFNDRDIRFATIMAYITSLALGNDLPLPLELQNPAA